MLCGGWVTISQQGSIAWVAVRGMCRWGSGRMDQDVRQPVQRCGEVLMYMTHHWRLVRSDTSPQGVHTALERNSSAYYVAAKASMADTERERSEGGPE